MGVCAYLRKTPGIMHTNCVSPARCNSSADTDQRNKWKPLRGGDKKHAPVVCKVGVLDLSFY